MNVSEYIHPNRHLLVMTSTLCACIIAPPGQLRDGLHVLLRAIPQIEVVCAVDDIATALALGDTTCPTIALLDCDGQSHAMIATLAQLKANWSHTRCIALVDHEQQSHTATVAGADVVLVKGMLATRLFTTIEDLVRQQR